MANNAVLQIKILTDASSAAAGMDKAAASASRFGSGVRSTILPLAGAAVAADKLGGFLKSAAEAAAEDAQGHTQLALALQNSTGATQDQVAAVEDWISKTSLASGVADDQLRPALATLARATGDLTTAQGAMGVAMDVAAATGKPLTDVANALAKGYGGNTTALGKLVPGLSKAVLATKDMGQVTGELSRLTGGAAAANASTAAGQYAKMKVAIQETKEGIGAGLLPIMTQLGSVLAGVGGWISQNTGAFTALVLAVGGVAGVFFAAQAAVAVYNVVQGIQIGLTAASTAEIQGNTAAMVAYAVRAAAVRVATLAWAAAQIVLDIAMSPTTLIILAIVAAIGVLVFAILYVIRHFGMFRNAALDVWGAVRAAASGIVSAWQAVQRAVSTAVSAVLGFLGNLAARAAAPFHAIRDAIQDVIGWIQRFVDKIMSVVLPDWLTGGLSKITGLLDRVTGRSAAAAPQSAALARVAAPAARAGTVPATTAGMSRAGGPLFAAHFDVILDGARVTSFVDRVVMRALDAEGARLVAGAWGV